jgi:hypothetical protein
MLGEVACAGVRWGRRGPAIGAFWEAGSCCEHLMGEVGS